MGNAGQTTLNSEDQWLVRTATNEVIGPISREVLIAQIREGKLGLEDEVCKANSYWIYLDEADEVKRQLGIEMPRSTRGQQDDSTETDLQAMTQELHVPASGLGGGGSDSEEGDGGTKVLNGRGNQRSGDGRKVRFDRRGYRGQMGQEQPLILGRVETPSFWRFVVGALIILTGVMVAWVIRYLQALP